MDQHGVTEVKPGKYIARIYVGKDVTGRQVYKSKTYLAKNMTAAIRERNRFAVQVEDDKRKGASTRGTIAQIVDEWDRIVGQKRASSTWYRNQSILAAIRRDLGTIRCADLTALDIDRWYAALPERNARVLTDGTRVPLSPSTVNHYHRVLSAILRQGRKWKMIPTNPAEDASPPAKGRKKVIPPTSTALELLLSTATPELRLAAQLGAAGGMRAGEVMAIRWTDLDNGWLSIRRAISDIPGRPLEVKATKTDEERKLELDDQTIALLEQQFIRRRDGAADEGATFQADGWVFPNFGADPSGNTPRSPGWLSQAWTRHCARVGVKVKFHNLRHWNASRLLTGGVDVVEVSARLGHKQTSTTLNIYAHLVPGVQGKARGAITQAMREITP